MTKIKTYRSHRAAKAAARKALGPAAIEGTDYKLTPVSLTEDPDDRWNVGYVWTAVQARPAVRRGIMATEG